MTAPTLAEFLLARIAEDEAAARVDLGPYDWASVASFVVDEIHDDHLDAAHRHIARHDPARVLADCEAKRQLVKLAETVSGMDTQIEGEWGTRGSVPWEEDQGVYLLRILASVYADHPEFRPEWRP